MTERERFEAWLNKDPLIKWDVSRLQEDDDQYWDWHVDRCWRAWQAALVPLDDDGEPLTKESIEQELEDSELRWTFSFTDNAEFYLFQRGSHIVLKKVKTRGDVRILVQALV